jgi:hypothetical protein
MNTISDEYISLDIQKWYNASKEELEYIATLSEDEQLEYWTRQEEYEDIEEEYPSDDDDDDTYEELEFNTFRTNFEELEEDYDE